MALFIVLLRCEPEFIRYMDVETFFVPEPTENLLGLVDLLDGKSERAVRRRSQLGDAHIDLMDRLANLVQDGDATRSLSTPVAVPPQPVQRIAFIAGPEF